MSSCRGTKTVEELRYIRVTQKDRRDSDGKCCECGACCDRVIMLSQYEQRKIQRYLKENPNIKKRVLEIYKSRPHSMCPFLDVTKAEHKCMIYHTYAFPMICRFFSCGNQKNTIIVQRNDSPENVDLWARFFGDTDITKYFIYYEQYQKIGAAKTIPLEVRLNPERFKDYFEHCIPECELSLLKKFFGH